MPSASNDDDDAAAAGPWADLLPELCGLVVDRLDPISVLRFPAVCAGWAAAAAAAAGKESPRQLRSGAPTLLTSGLDTEGVETEHDVDAGAFALHSVSAAAAGCGGGGGRSSFLGEADGLKGRTWVGGKDDWLVTTDYACSVELLNPVSGDRVPLPWFDTTQGEGVELKVPGYLHVIGNNGCWHKILKVTLCQTPAHRRGYLAVALFSDGLLAFTEAGDKCWTALKNPAAASRLDLSYMDTIVLDGKLFAVNEFGRIYSWDIMSSKTTEPEMMVIKRPEIEISRHCGRGFYLASSSRGQLLLVYIYGGDTELFKESRICSRLVFNDRWSFYELGMSLHELDAGGGAWRRVKDLGGDRARALFLGAHYPFYITVPPGSDDEDLKANCVYVADTPSGYDAGIFHLNKGEDGSVVERLAYSLMADPLQMPIWFRPTTHPRLVKDI